MAHVLSQQLSAGTGGREFYVSLVDDDCCCSISETVSGQMKGFFFLFFYWISNPPI